MMSSLKIDFVDLLEMVVISSLMMVAKGKYKKNQKSPKLIYLNLDLNDPGRKIDCILAL